MVEMCNTELNQLANLYLREERFVHSQETENLKFLQNLLYPCFFHIVQGFTEFTFK